MPSYVRGQGRRSLSDAEIIDLYARGTDSDTIGYRANCSGTTVIAIAKAAGVEIRKKGGKRHSLSISDAEIVSRYKAGQSGPQIARDIGCTPSSVYHALRRCGEAARMDATAIAKMNARKQRTKRDG